MPTHRASCSRRGCLKPVSRKPEGVAVTLPFHQYHEASSTCFVEESKPVGKRLIAASPPELLCAMERDTEADSSLLSCFSSEYSLSVQPCSGRASSIARSFCPLECGFSLLACRFVRVIEDPPPPRRSGPSSEALSRRGWPLDGTRRNNIVATCRSLSLG